MSATGCWRCGSSSHHRRDCQVTIDKDSAALTKKESIADHRRGKKTLAELSKSGQKLAARNSPPTSASLLKHHLGVCCQQLCDAEVLLDKVGTPTTSRTTWQLEQLGKEVLREIVSHTKNYLHSEPKWDTEDRFMKADVDYLDEVRPKLMASFSRTIANLREIERQMFFFMTESAKTLDILESGETLLGERSPSMGILEKAVDKYIEAQQSINGIKDIAIKIQILATDFDQTWINELEEKLVALKTHRRTTVDDHMSELEEKVTCTICFTDRSDTALKCGHRLCKECVKKIQRLNALCPIETLDGGSPFILEDSAVHPDLK